MSKKIFLITKLKTTNIGNEALSSEIMNLFSGAASDITLNVNGRPFGLDGYYPKRIIHTADPVAVLERWANTVAKQINKEDDVAFKANKPAVALLKADSTDFKNEGWKAKLRPFKRWLVSFLPYAGQYKKRAAQLKQADWLIYSGAGEVGDNIVFLRQLVEIRAAQILGKKTAAVNQSVVIKTPVFQKLVGHVYGKMNKVVIRGEITRKNLVGYGVPEQVIEVAPDSAINAPANVVPPMERNSGLVAINITPRVSMTVEQMGSLVSLLQSKGKKLAFVTNEPYEDGKMAKIFAANFNIPQLGPFANYQEYIKKLSECEFVISARLHTNMLSLVSHTPIIPIEGNVFKTTELLRQLQYPILTLDSSQSNWTERLMSETEKMLAKGFDFNQYFNTVFPAYKKAVQRNAAWINEQV